MEIFFAEFQSRFSSEPIEFISRNSQQDLTYFLQTCVQTLDVSALLEAEIMSLKLELF